MTSEERIEKEPEDSSNKKDKRNGQGVNRKELSLALWASAVVAFANIAMTLVLLAVYIGTYRRIRSSFTLGLVLFGSFFVILNLSILVFWLFLFQNVNVSSATTLVDQASFYMLLVNVGEALAISNLLRITWK